MFDEEAATSGYRFVEYRSSISHLSMTLCKGGVAQFAQLFYYNTRHRNGVKKDFC